VENLSQLVLTSTSPVSSSQNTHGRGPRTCGLRLRPLYIPISSAPPEPASSPADRIGPDILTYSYTSCDWPSRHPQNSACSPLEYPSRSLPRCHNYQRPSVIGASPHVSLTSYPDLFTSGERCDPPRFLSIAKGLESDSTGNGEKGVLGGHPMIPTASDKVHAEIPETNGAIILFFPEDST